MSRKKGNLSRVDQQGQRSAGRLPPEGGDAAGSRREMFSPASFYDIIHARPEGVAGVAEPEAPTRPAVVAFYGFRGGAGRTLSLAHAAVGLADAGHRVVAIDLDLEAPGLHTVLGAPNTKEGAGALELLRLAMTSPPEKEIPIDAHMVFRDLPTGARVRILPAGPLSDRYLASLEELQVSAWHMLHEPAPLGRLLQNVERDLSPHVVMLDCRTGLSGLAASAAFHVADAVVCFLPLSEQALEGLRVFLAAAAAAKARRDNRPALLLVPTMVPEGTEGRSRLEAFIRHFEDSYLQYIRNYSPDTIEADDDELAIARLTVPILREGIAYQHGIALTGRLDDLYLQRARSHYQPLTDWVLALAGLKEGGASPEGSSTPSVDAARILEEMVLPGEMAFAEYVDLEDLQRLFVPPTDFGNLLDRATAFIVGAKGAGKSWLWRYLVRGLPISHATFGIGPHMKYIAGLEPQQDDAQTDDASPHWLSGDAFKEIDRTAKMKQHDTYRAFWHLSALARLSRQEPYLKEVALDVARGHEKRKVKAVLSAADRRSFQDALIQLLLEPTVGTLAEETSRAVDRALLQKDHTFTLVYDGLDTAFDGELQRRFVAGLAQMVYAQRGILRRIFFKVFLREDVYHGLDIQNQSHLEPTKMELSWKSADLWRIALNIAKTSPSYMAIVQQIRPGAAAPWKEPDEVLRSLLYPLWGEQLEAGNKISTANYIQNRTADGKGRLFPRTLVQLITAAVGEEKRQRSFRHDRVLRSTSIQTGFVEASERRLDDLMKEYNDLKPYLTALLGMNPTGTRDEIVRHLTARVKKKSARGTESAALHTGPAGWKAVIDRLVEVGVLAEYKRARGEKGEPKYQVALLYRPAIGVKAFGV